MDSLWKWAGRRATFRYPIGPAPRTAVLAGWFASPKFFAGGLCSGNPVRIFRQGWCEEAAVFAPEAVAAPRDQLLELATRPPRLTHAVIALSRPGDPLLTAAERERLWRAFHVPAFEQIIGERGELLAAECEAHDGLHVETSRAWTEYAIDRSLCACGQKSPRLGSPAPGERVRSAAAYAR